MAQANADCFSLSVALVGRRDGLWRNAIGARGLVARSQIERTILWARSQSVFPVDAGARNISGNKTEDGGTTLRVWPFPHDGIAETVLELRCDFANGRYLCQ
jgi:hypothetical protein